MKRVYLILVVLSLIIAWRVTSIPRESVPVAVEDTSVPPTTLFSTEQNGKASPRKGLAEGKSESNADFKSFLNETLLVLPTEASAKEKKVDPHHGDPGIGEASTALGKIVDEMKENPALIPDGLEFYRSCALKNSVIPAIRALCLRNLADWNEKSPRKLPFSWNDFPSQIQFIAKQLPVTR